MITRRISASEQGKRLHRYLRMLMPNMPLGRLYKMIDQGKVRVNGKRKKQNYELVAGDELTLLMDEAEFEQASAGGRTKPKFAGVSTRLDIVYEDGELLVVNKPAGLLTHPDRTEWKNTLINRVHAYLYRKGELDSTLFLPATANRLDRNTSGLVLIGKTAGMLHRLNRWLQNRELQKYYVTIVQGRLEGEGTIEASLVRDERRNRTRVVKDGDDGDAFPGGSKAAITRYRALASAGGCTLVEAELVSGRPHQIRSHFQSIGHPLLGDLKYGGRRFGELNHQLLHAWRVVLPDGREFRAAPPPLMRRTMAALGLTWQEGDVPAAGPADRGGTGSPHGGEQPDGRPSAATDRPSGESPNPHQPQTDRAETGRSGNG